jgi:hypothetical protein
MSRIDTSVRARAVGVGVMTVILLALVAAAGGLIVQLARRSPGGHPTALSPAARLIEDRPGTRPRPRPAALSQDPLQLWPSERQTRPAPESPETSPEQLRVETSLRAELIERTLKSESVDAAWASHAERAIAAAVAADPVLRAGRLVATVCRTSLCRVEASHGSRREALRFGTVLPNRLAAFPSGTMRVLPAAEHDFRTVIYLAREGHRVPRVP